MKTYKQDKEPPMLKIEDSGYYGVHACTNYMITASSDGPNGYITMLTDCGEEIGFTPDEAISVGQALITLGTLAQNRLTIKTTHEEEQNNA